MCFTFRVELAKCVSVSAVSGRQAYSMPRYLLQAAATLTFLPLTAVL